MDTGWDYHGDEDADRAKEDVFGICGWVFGAD